VEVTGTTRGNGASGEPTVSSSLEHLVAGSQGVITKRIELALLEGQEFLSRSIERAVLAGVAMVMAAAAWFAGAGVLVMLVVPEASPVARLAAFGLMNAAGAAGLAAFASRHSRPPKRVRPNGSDQTRRGDHAPGDEKS